MDENIDCCKSGIQWNEPSTQRGLVWIAAAVLGALMIWTGRDIGPLMILAAAVAGGLGVGISDAKK